MRESTFAAYDFNTGLVISNTDENGLETTFKYDPLALRRSSMKLPTGAMFVYVYDEVALSLTTRAYLSSGSEVTSEETVFLNGIGERIRIETTADRGATSVIRTKYDNLNRVNQRSAPFFKGGTPRWTTLTYDDFGRVKTEEEPDGSTSRYFYNEPVATRALPAQARDQVGQTLRVVDA